MTKGGAAMRLDFGTFALSVADDRVAILQLDRPPVNVVYEDLGRIIDHIEGEERIRAVVWTAAPDARAWCGGADLHDFDGIHVEGRKARYVFINAQLPRFYALDRPVIAALTGPASASASA